MDHLPAISVAVCVAGLAVVFLLSIFALRHIVVWARQRASIAYRPLDHSYHDADGKAIELSMPTASKPVLSHGGRSLDGEGSKGCPLNYGREKWGLHPRLEHLLTTRATTQSARISLKI